MYRLLAVDVDGTLVRRDGHIDERDRHAIARLREQGVIVTLATGRLYEGTRPVAEQLGLTGLLVCSDGASLMQHPERLELSHSAIGGEDAAVVRDALRRRREQLTVVVVADRGVVVDPSSAPFDAIVRTWTPHIERVEAALDHACWNMPRLFAVIAFGSRDAIQGVELEVRAASSIDVVRYDFPAQEELSSLITSPAGVSKGTGVAAVAAAAGLSLDQVVAVGDWLNDIPMFRVVGRSFAMGQAPEAVSRAATDRLQAVAHGGGGVAEAIERAWG
jgi:Cof subfamily protein (haloacid dehalogenase superfamily)